MIVHLSPVLSPFYPCLTLFGRIALICSLLLTVVACTTTQIEQLPANLDKNASWALLPMLNHTETPQAGLRAEAILESLIRSGGIRNLKRYPSSLNTESLFDPVERKALEQAMQWAKGEKARYAISGTVDEWRYKVGVDGEPAVGLTLQVTEVSTGNVIWTAAGSKSGWSREALSAVAQKLIAQLTSPLTNQLTTQVTAPLNVESSPRR